MRVERVVVHPVYLLCLACLALTSQPSAVHCLELGESELVSGDDVKLNSPVTSDAAVGLGEEFLDDSDLELQVVGSAAEVDDGSDELTPVDWTDRNKPLFGVLERVYAGAYDKINKELVKQVATDNVGENINYAKLWLDSLKNGTSLFKEDLMAALGQFIELERIIDDDKCNRVVYGILMKNLRGVRDKALKYDTPYGPIRRVDKIVFKFAMQHAIKCLPRYPQLMNELIEREDLKPVERVAILYGGLYKSCDLPKPIRYQESGFSCRKFTSFIPKPKVEGEVLLKTLLKLASHNSTDIGFLLQPKHQNEEKGKMDLNKSKVEAVVDKYVFEPCKLFVREIGLNVVKPAKMDFSVLDEEDIEGIKDEFNTCLFCVGRQRYSFCKIVIKRRDIMVDTLVSEMRKHSYEQVAMKLYHNRMSKP